MAQDIPSHPTHASRPSPFWKPWNIPTDPVIVGRRLCGLLNKITAYNFPSVSDQIAHCFLDIERSHDPAVGELYGNAIAQILRSLFHCPNSSQQPRLYASLCRRVMDELERERGYWEFVDYHDVNPAEADPAPNYFVTSIRSMLATTFRRFHKQRDRERLCNLMQFCAELLVQDLLRPEDVCDQFTDLCREAADNDSVAVAAVRRFCLAIFRSFNAPLLLHSLHVIDELECVLKGSCLRPMIQYTVSAILTRAQDIETEEIFGLSEEGVEYYGLDASPTTSSDELEQGSDVTEPGLSLSRLHYACVEGARTFVSTGNIQPANAFLQQLLPEHRHIFVGDLIRTAILAGDPASASTAVSHFFELPATRQACHNMDSFAVALGDELGDLPDVTLDIPHAACYLALMTVGSGIDYAGAASLSEKALGNHDERNVFLGEYAAQKEKREVR
ncbi:hypothetical protein GLOTRDRAFT_138773 [Gloeophyllum trabeum ATCC 11539]|uniref:ARM repeat-containing protein n=1 Tax=Gloeophyllum trabeum (strain ATCC 11539 / FP-39264 / Madison 617) TaxID=670483 RepID=S7RQA6_GLOTA|nr:uncharacterized protein GLOTRDRAFT_138773 [Gloeophyllum trabeum ATCC 11539]EPQ55079.1 hypothetical protein GLOTRDRAFT_138773 [Gloeophyllum trabeum ATCC 11539]